MTVDAMRLHQDEIDNVGTIDRIKLVSFSPHRLRYVLDQNAHEFRHNVERDLNFFVIWEKGRAAEEEIAQLIRDRFTLLYAAEITWSDDNIARNFSRLYDRLGIEKARKALRVGGGPFLLFVVWDRRPRYIFDRSVSGDIEINNANVAVSKRLFREISGGKYLVHSSNNIREFFEQAVLLLGPKKFEEILTLATWNGQIERLNQDLAGSGGWSDLHELFAVLNYSANYLVLRNYEYMHDNFTGGDIDFLCDRLTRFAAAANASKRGAPKKLSKFTLSIAGQDVPIDARFVGDGYYHELWQSGMLQRKKLYSNLVYAPREDDHFFSLLYHAKIQKSEVKPAYLLRLEELARKIGMDWVDRELILEDERAANLLAGYMRANGLHYVEPFDQGVVRNAAVIELLKNDLQVSTQSERPTRGKRAEGITAMHVAEQSGMRRMLLKRLKRLARFLNL